MNDSSIHSQQPPATVTDLRTSKALRALAFLVATLRPNWDEPGIIAACSKALEGGRELADLTVAAVRAAQSPACRTPAAIPLPGEHWRSPVLERTPTPQKYVHPPTPPPLSTATLELRAETRRKLAETRRLGPQWGVPDGSDVP